MDAHTFHDIQTVIRKLDDCMSQARYGENRGGMVPPDAISPLVEDIRDALATLDMLHNAPRRIRAAS